MIFFYLLRKESEDFSSVRIWFPRLFVLFNAEAEERIVTVPHREVRVPDVIVEVQAEGPAPLWLLLYSRGVVPTSARKTLEK